MKTFVPVLAALGLAITWTALLVAIPSVLGVFPDFRLEAPPLTIALIWSYKLCKGLALPLLMLATALLLGFKRRLGWMFALVLCVACDLGFFGLLLPLVALINTLGGEGDSVTLSPSVPLIPDFESPLPLGWGVVLAIAAFLLNQHLFVLLWVKRHDFRR